MGNQTQAAATSADMSQYIDDVLDDIDEKEKNQHSIMTVTVDGNIGAGKTTLIREMADIEGVLVIEEPMDEWDEVLASIKRNPKEYSFQLGLRTMTHFMNVDSKIKEIKNTNVDRPRIIIVERNARTQILAFQETAKDNGLLDEDQMKVLRTIYAMIAIQFDRRIFINTSTETCMKRIKQRGRGYEDGITKDILQKYHEKMALCHSKLQRSECAYKAMIDGEQTKKKIKDCFMQILKDREGKFNEFGTLENDDAETDLRNKSTTLVNQNH